VEFDQIIRYRYARGNLGATGKVVVM